MFDFQKLEVYKKSKLFHSACKKLIRENNFDNFVGFHGRYDRSFETEGFIYFLNFQEFDLNGNTMMYHRVDFSIVSYNYFTGNDFYDLMKQGLSVFTYLSKSAWQSIKSVLQQSKTYN